MKTCVYTILLGNYELLNEQPVAHQSGMPFICLTDDPELKSDTWRIVQVEPTFRMDPIRSQRILKLCPHQCEALEAFDHSLYIDNTVVLTESPERIIERYGVGPGLSLPSHSFRDTVLDEFHEVAAAGFDDQNRIFEQLNHYLSYDEATLSEKPFWSAILLRDHRDTRVCEAMEIWLAHVLRYSRRDQLSANLAFRQTGVPVQIWDIDNGSSWFHSWPHAPKRDRFAGPRSPLASMTPPHLQIQTLQRDLKALESTNAVQAGRMARMTAEAEAVSGQLLKRSAELEAVSALLKVELQTNQESRELRAHDAFQMTSMNERLKAQVDALRQARDESAALLDSRSWRLTAPLRAVKRWMAAGANPTHT